MLEFLGRNDFQVKVRGFRIEPGEVEAALLALSGVREAAVVARDDASGSQRLVAYYVGEEALAVDTLRAHLSAHLPEYMVPAAYVRLDELPLTPSRKLDRKALPVPEGDAYAVRGYEAPRGGAEEVLAGIWAEVLGSGRVGRHDHFFELGGHSLLAVQVVSRVRQALGAEVPVGEVFARPVLADFARALERASAAELPPIEAGERGERLELSFAQQRLWFLDRMEGAGAAYHIPSGLRLAGALGRSALGRALDRIVARHEALRTTFVERDGVPVQRIAPAGESCFPLAEHDLRGHAAAEAELQRLSAEEAEAPFDLERGPLARGRLVRLGEAEHALLVSMHHIVSDGWSMGVFVEELSALYAAFVQGRGDPLPELAVQYADYAAWQRRWMAGEVLREQAGYWRATLAGVPELLEVPADRARPARQDYAGGVVPLTLEAELTAGLKALGRGAGTTPFMTLLGGWAALLGRLTGQEDLVVGTPTANRGRREVEGLIGFFVNTLALRVELSGSPTVGELLGRVKERALGAQQHQDLPFEQVVELVRPARSLAHGPLVQVMFVWQNAPRGKLELPGLTLAPLQASPPATAKYDLSLKLYEADGAITGGVEYASSLFDRATVERYARHLRTLLAAMAADAGERVDRLPLLGAEERRQLLEGWNVAEAEYPQASCVHELFQAQAARTPDAAAVVFEGGSLTYGELNARANRLAHHLRALGVGPDARVAICVERSPEMVVGLLAVLKAGGAYVPLDPAYPADRLRWMLEDSAPAALLTDGALDGLPAGSGLPVLDLAAGPPAWEGRPATDPERLGLRPDHLAYVIYTSGSTGTPKGV
ncbi:MAG TPA: condensation domain-containing protein, partial [Longimicrobiaceae bacterium]|nr:condensation domain-containing protein [Longimicrobiaceae bacterium]